MAEKNEPHTKAETFILESLSLDDEAANRLDGKVLHDILRIQGKNPVYRYFRTKTELKKFAEEFFASGYRYLHISCHGSPSHLELTMETCGLAEVADYFDGKLNNRRVFVSGCSLGSGKLAAALFAKNPGMYSTTAPAQDVFFAQTCAFWPTFYYMMHSVDSKKMKKVHLGNAFSTLASIFELKLAHFFHSTKTNAIDVEYFSGGNIPVAMAGRSKAAEEIT